MAKSGTTSSAGKRLSRHGKSDRSDKTGTGKPNRTGGKETRAAARPDDAPVIALDLPAAPLSPQMEAYFRKCEEKLGFVPNVLKAYAFDNAKLEAFVAMYNDLMLAPSGLSKQEREMIAAAVSSQNRCYYCLTAHGAAVRQYSGDPLLGEHLVMNYRAARLGKRQRAMLDFAVRLTTEPWAVEDEDRDRLRRMGFSERDIWDIAAVTGFFNMSNRLASATDMRPNPAYHSQARESTTPK
ncbi:MAG TPA: peroxidase-related enzyme [Pseudolabrys sp.]|nr:peroxidase-related enzyme [Pseudolabrys sp.]